MRWYKKYYFATYCDSYINYKSIFVQKVSNQYGAFHIRSCKELGENRTLHSVTGTFVYTSV